MNSPVEPWAGALRALMLGLGAMLLVGFAAPWSLSPELAFSWDRIADATTTYERLAPIMLVATGLVAVLLAVLPVAAAGRGMAAAVVGAGALIAVEASSGVGLSYVATRVGTLALVAGLLLRSQYRSSMLARGVVTVAALVVILLWLIPEGGASPLVVAFGALGTDAPASFKIVIAAELFTLVLAAVALFAWLPAPSSAAADMLAWLVIARIPAVALLELVLLPDAGGQLSADLFGALIFPLATAAWLALAGFGAATLFGKTLEPG